jgi:hypothetical protein
MKSRNREINIFNMSLLDILCGALGAFCFMMLTLLPYYHPPGEDFKKVTEEQKKMLDEVKDVKDLLEKLKFTSNAEDQRELVKMLQDKIDALENRIKELQGEVNTLMAEKEELKKQMQQLKEDNDRLLARNDQLEQENKQLQEDKQKLKNQLEDKMPWSVVMTSTDASQHILSDLQEIKLGLEDGKKWPDFNPTKSIPDIVLAGDDFFGSGPTFVNVQTDRVGGAVYRVYTRLSTESALLKESAVSGYVSGYGLSTIPIPAVNLTPARPWALIGTVETDAHRVLKFVPSTPEQRDVEWERISKTKPPAAKPAPAAADADTRRQAEAARRRMPNGGGLSDAAMGRVRQFSGALNNTKDPGDQQKLHENALRSADSDAERNQINYIWSRATGAPLPGPGPNMPRLPSPGARGPAVPVGVNPSPQPSPPAPAPASPPPPPK